MWAHFASGISTETLRLTEFGDRFTVRAHFLTHSLRFSYPVHWVCMAKSPYGIYDVCLCLVVCDHGACILFQQQGEESSRTLGVLDVD